MDFFQVRDRETRRGVEVYADFIVGPSNDLMIRGGAFYAIWDEGQGRWSTNELDVLRLIDVPIYDRANQLREKGTQARPIPLSIYNNGAWTRFLNYCSRMPDMYVPLDSTLVFANQPVRREDYSSKRLPYDLAPGKLTAYSKLMNVLFEPGEKQKLEWAVGAVISGDGREIQKFIVLYGEGGTGKGTFLHILELLFQGYWAPFDAQALIKRSNTFAMEAFKSNPIVAISHDSDLSMIEDNTSLNSIVSHEEITINEKYRSLYAHKFSSFLFIGTNLSVRITDAKSGLIRRLIDVNPTGKRVPPAEYEILVSQIGFELGAIAHHCLDVYRRTGKHYYANYRPTDMMVRTDILYNFLLASFDMLRERDGITLKEAWNLYKDYCREAGFEHHLNMHRFRDEMRNYFNEFHVKTRVGGEEVRSLFRGFKVSKLNFLEIPEVPGPSIVLDQEDSLLDQMLADRPAQYATEEGTPLRKWANVKTTLASLDTSKLHFVKPPENHIVIDFDLKGDTGEKSLQLNLEAASKFPPTYAEYSQSGQGIHLHFIYTSDVTLLSRVYDAGIEVKVFTGDASLRRKLTKCSDVPVAMISDGLPLKEKRVIDTDQVRSERGLRRLIQRNLFKEIHPGTKPSIDFIHKILEDAFESGMQYDVTDLRPRILAFANNSTNNAQYCIKRVLDMKFTSSPEKAPVQGKEQEPERIAFYDVEVFPNLFVLCWKYRGAPDETTVKLVNPSPSQVEEVTKLPLAGYNNRRFDNHILWARMMGYSELDLFRLSQRIVSGDRNAFFSEAYGLSYADIWDFLTDRKSLKRWQIELGLNHRELGLPWDQPVDPARWQEVVDYCVNDVVTEETVFEHRQQDFVARQILAALSGLRVNDTTQRHTAKIIFGDERNPQEKFVYTDLSGQFPGYQYEAGKSTYKGEVVGEGGYVYAEPGIYENVAVLDVASMHPTSIEKLGLFGPEYTERYANLKRARIAIKHGDYGLARRLLGERASSHLGTSEGSRALADALKIALNIVYGLTSASFDNPFRDLRNKDNIVAKRGALFMIDLKEAIKDAGYEVIHIKTDSVKIPGVGGPFIVDVVKNFGREYGYEFEYEIHYGKICLVNDAVYIARTAAGEWTATGAQFAHPYVFKTLFSKEPVEFQDLCETRSVAGAALYLDFGDENPHFVGSSGSFTPVKEGSGGGTLLRGKDGVYHSASGAKGYFWKEAAVVKELGLEEQVDMNYFRKLADDAVAAISRYGDFEWFTS